MDRQPLFEFARAARGAVDALFKECLSSSAALEASVAFSTAIESQWDNGALGGEILLHYFDSGFTQEEAGLSLLDGCTGFLKLSSRRDEDPLRSVISNFEAAIDFVMLNRPARFLPRNGSFAQAADAVGLDRYINVTPPRT